MAFKRFRVPAADNDYAGTGPMRDTKREKKIIQGRKQGMTHNELATTYGVSRRHVWDLLRREGIS